jgi:thiopeptide-type bacteriocin biosynthesis protein
MSPPNDPVSKSLDAAPSGFFAFRTPLLPFDALTSFSDGLAAPKVATGGDGGGGVLGDALANDRALLEARLRALVTQKDVREALFVASPSLDEGIEAWLSDGGSARARGVVEILVRYLVRMSARCTPFGLFSGCSVGALGKDTRLTLAPRAEYRRHTRLDTHYLSKLCEELERDPAIRASARWTPSSGLFPSAGQLRYAEARIDPVTRDRSFHLVSVELTDYLASTMERARRGATAMELAQALVDADAEVTLEEAAGYIDLLIDSQILVSDLAPPVTGREPIEDIEQTLLAHGARAARAGGEGSEGALHDKAATVLAQVTEALDAMDREGLGLSQDRYKDVAASLAALPAKTELPRLFQVDLFKPAPGAQLGGAPLREIQRALDMLAKMRRPEGRRGEALRRFREAFSERYESREVPLMEVLDDERGIGFESATAGSSEPSPLLNDLFFPPTEAPSGTYGAHEEWLLGKLAPLLRSGAREWVIDAKEMQSLEAKTLATPPDAFAVMATLASASPEALAKGEFTLWMHGVSGPSGAVLLGRFCHGDDELRRRVEEHLRAEEALRPDAIFAEIVHLPEGRLGNILCRPLLRAHEIPFLGRSGAPEEMQIALTDLRVSVAGGRVILRSERLGREVLPRLTSAHNFPMAALGAYRFLCALQSQDSDGIPGFTWGSLARAPFLPRVTYGRVILSLARWTIGRDALKALDAKNDAGRFRAVEALRGAIGLPRWISVVDGDNVLPLDLDNVLHVDSFVALVKNRSAATLQELFPSPGEMCASGPEGLFVHELVVPFVRTRQASEDTARAVSSRARQAPLGPRTFAPGSQWLYAKLYTGTATADRVLHEVVAPLVDESLSAGDAESWFFIRYADPRWHLRLRLRGDPERLVTRVLPRLHARTEALLADGRLAKIQLDTYEREVERYGGDRAMLLSEEIFRADSDAVLAILSGMSGDEAADARWRLTFRGMHMILIDLGLDLPARLALMKRVRAGFAAEHNVSGPFEKQLGDKFRKERAALEHLLSAPSEPVDGEEPTLLHPGFAALDARSQTIRRVASEIASLAKEGLLIGDLPDLASSHLHMHANRLLRSEQRAQELVLYDFLLRLYDSESARGRDKRPKRATDSA